MLVFSGEGIAVSCVSVSCISASAALRMIRTAVFRENTIEADLRERACLLCIRGTAVIDICRLGS